MKEKPKIAIVSLTSCEGCQFVLLDLGRRFFNFLEKVNLIDFKLIEEKPLPKGKIDVVFVEGNPITREEVSFLKRIRRKTKILVVLGNCAALGGIPEIKNYQNKERTIRHIYKNLEGVVNPDIKEVDNFVKVDFTIPGCPIDGEEFLKAANILIQGKIPVFPNKPVCSECPLRGGDNCFLRKNEPCLGPIIFAGCGAVCPTGGLPCYGCRGLLKNINPAGFLKTLQKMRNKEEIEEDLELFGIKDSVSEREKVQENL